MVDDIQNVLSSPYFLGIWLAQAAFALFLLLADFKNKNPEIHGIMKFVWFLTVGYSGLFGLAVYFYSGRKQISKDDLWRRSFRSVAHCYSGCGAGEILGVTTSVGLFALGQVWVALFTFLCAYTFGLILTILPLRKEGESWGTATKDAFISESASIVVMEAVAIGVDLWLAGESGLGDILFWSSLIVSLTAGLLAAYPVNVALVYWGVKEGMHDPREMAKHAQGLHHQHAH